MSDHYIENRPWGSFEILKQFEVKADNGTDVCVKELVAKPGQRLSYQSHKFRTEHWTIVQGEGKVILNDIEKKVKAGDNIDIPVGTKHRLINDGKQDLIWIEVSTGHFDENDNIRYEDDYGRL